MLMPITLLGVIMLLNYSPKFQEISNDCKNRAMCDAYCIKDNFPLTPCEPQDFEIEYNGNLYNKFFKFENPRVSNELAKQAATKLTGGGG